MTETVRDILRNDKRQHEGEAPIETAFREISNVSALLGRLEKAATDDDDWEQIYDQIFNRDPSSVAGRTRGALELAGVDFVSYCDPDTTYEEDARAWISAFKETARKVHDAYWLHRNGVPEQDDLSKPGY